MSLSLRDSGSELGHPTAQLAYCRACQHELANWIALPSRLTWWFERISSVYSECDPQCVTVKEHRNKRVCQCLRKFGQILVGISQTSWSFRLLCH